MMKYSDRYFIINQGGKTFFNEPNKSTPVKRILIS